MEGWVIEQKIQDSFYYAFGETVDEYEAQRVTRIYWNIQAEGAARLMERPTGGLNIDRRYYPITALLAESIHADVRDWLNPGTPLFTKRLADGLALAEDPGDSFGKHRCTILARAMAASCGTSPEERLAELRRHFEQQGLSLDAPWLNANSPGEYEYPFPTS